MDLRKFACPACWARMPRELRAQINNAYAARVLAHKAGAPADTMRDLARLHEDAKRAGRDWLARTGGQQ